MSKEIRSKGVEFAKFLETLPPEEIDKGNRKSYEEAEDEYRRFVDHFHRGICYLCEKPLSSFSKKLPCAHWLLKPKGFKKKDFAVVADEYGYFQIQSYLRWVANQDGFGRNINDLKEEGSGSKLFEVTIRFRNLEWAFSCAESDYQGHATSQHSKHPHYHFQMRIDRRPFINYSDFHAPFSEMDIINIEAMRSRPEKIRQRFSFGEGISEILNDDSVESIVNSSLASASEEDATFKLDTLVLAEEGKTISGDDLYAIIQEAKEKGVTVASLLHKLPNASVRVMVTPGPGVVEQAPRGGRAEDA